MGYPIDIGKTEVWRHIYADTKEKPMANAVKNMLSVEEVRAIAEELVAQGVQPSGNTLVTAAHARQRPMSKRTALKHLEVLAAQGITFTPAAPVPIRTADDDPVYHTAPAPAVDPVAVAEAALKAAERHFFDARDALMQAKKDFLATQPLPVQGILHGSLNPQDEIHQEALADVDSAKRDYDTAWQRREQARYTRDQAKEAPLEAAKRAWVAHYRPQVVKSLAATQKKMARTDLSRWERADAVQQYGFARLAYNEAMNEASAALNGATP
jgi:hypothetical protein